MRKWQLGAAALLVLSAAALAQDSHTIDLAGMNQTIRPGDDFYAYANGAWLMTAQIPPDSGSWGRLVELREDTRHRTAEILEDAAKLGVKRSREAEEVGDFYASFMDEQTVEVKGITPLGPGLRKIAAITNKRGLARAFGAALRADVDPLNNTNFFTENLFGLWVAPDMNAPDHNTAYLLQGGLGLPNREYYLGSGEKMAGIRTAYQAHIANVLRLAGIADAEQKAARIFALETAIAKVHVSLADNSDVHKGNNPWSHTDFAARAPGLDWDSFFDGADLSRQRGFIVWQPSAFAGISALVRDTPLQTWKDYLAFHLVNHNSAYLSAPFTDELFDFYGRTLSGALEQRARWKRAVDAVNAGMPDAVGKLYAQKFFSSASKARVREMVDRIRAAFAHRIDGLDWMTPATRAQAKNKLMSLYVGIGYPEHWRSYIGLGISRSDLAGNVARAELFEYGRNLMKLDAPVDRTAWSMNPQTVNAVNLPLQNALNFPAAYLQPPFYDSDASAAYNYGSIGATIGHEISHSFDDQGSQFDAQGRLADWWTPEDFAHFRKQAEKLGRQYDSYCPFADLCVKGEQTMSENIADVAGVTVAYDGWKSLGERSGGTAGFSPEQAFFVSFGQRWRTTLREGAFRQQLLTDGHAPGQYRAQTVRNVDAWYAAFNVKPGDKLYLAPAERVHIW
jgi:predicted metalloendopeptidase